jgi:hypothetical protein
VRAFEGRRRGETQKKGGRKEVRERVRDRKR